MTIRQDGTLSTRRIEDAPTSHPWRWLGTIVVGAIICFAVVAVVAALMDNTYI